jgi:acetolactate synthase-1/2/3 large subunit
MKTSDYIVEYLISKGITDVFGYPGGMVTHLMDSFGKYRDKISAHVTYHEQGAAFAACGYAQASGKAGVAYATSGPGATNLITGICNAYFDSIPAVFITGQVNTFEAKGELGVRQRGFQETAIVPMVSGVTKFAAYVETAEKIKYYLDKAFFEATNNRKGPVLLDIPMNIFRTEIDPSGLSGVVPEKEIIEADNAKFTETVEKALKSSIRPCLLLGNGIKNVRQQEKVRNLVEQLKIPAVTSMIAFDVLTDSSYSYGFVGAYGGRTANIIVAKSDLIISLGSRLDVRQVGAGRENFASEATIIRVDIDVGEMSNKVHLDEKQFVMSLEKSIEILTKINIDSDYAGWISVCNEIKHKLANLDSREPNVYISEISKRIPDEVIITADVGQNQVWVAQSFNLKNKQEVLFSGGHGAMGYSLPAAIGAYYGSMKKPVICFNGDGGIQMNIQELQFIAREHLPIKIIVMNNSALGMIRHFQEMYFESRYFQTKEEGGYTVPDFCEIAKAYGINSLRISSPEQLKKIDWNERKPLLVDVQLQGNTYVFPKLEFGKTNQDQEPHLNRDLLNYLMSL